MVLRPAASGAKGQTCLATSVVAYVLLGLIPITVVERPTLGLGLSPAWLLVVMICVHQLLEQLATVSLFTWLADLVPPPVRRGYFARRALLQLTVIILALPGSGYLADAMGRDSGNIIRAYAVVVGAGAAVLLISLLPLVQMPARSSRRPGANPNVEPELWLRLRRDLFEPWTNAGSRRLLTFGLWFSFFNGLTAVAQNLYPKNILRLPLVDMQWMQATMRVGQMGVSAGFGDMSRRIGLRCLVALCQLLVGLGPLFYLAATPDRPYLLYGAWILWSAYAGINIALPIWTMRLSGSQGAGPHLAAYYAWTSLALTVGTLSGGYLFDQLVGWSMNVGPWSIDRYGAAFVLAAITRTAGVFWVLRIDDDSSPIRR